MPPRKTTAARKRAPEPSVSPPTDTEITTAIHDFTAAEKRYHDAYEEMMQARERVVSVLRAAGLDSFTSLRERY